MTTTTSLVDFLRVNFKNENGLTHTRIGNKELNIIGGAYYIDTNKEEQFYKLYYNYVFKQKHQEYLTEKQYDNGVICVDLDFNYEPSIDLRLHTEDHIHTIIQSYCSCLKKYFDFKPNDTFEIFVLEKPNINRLDIKTKDGIHIIIGLCLERKYQIDLRNEIMKQENVLNVLDQLPLINKIDDVFDNAISSGRNNWQMFGSKKPNNKAYELTYHYKIEYDENGFLIETQEIEEIDFDLFKRLIIRNLNRPSIGLLENINLNEINIPTGQDTTEENFNHYDEIKHLTEIEQLLECIGSSRCSTGKFKEWYEVGQAIKNELKNEGNKYFINWTNKYGSDNKKSEAYDQITKYIKYTPKKDKKRLAIASLHYWAKESNIELYDKLFSNNIIEFTDEENNTLTLIKEVMENSNETNFAKLYLQLTNNNIKCTDMKNKILYNCENGLWNQNIG